ncbi:type IV secretory system conjugative DNA transfer family protein [Asticcacaulis sp.]|uniref:type IV secretory system conjugative DNA transfer family protein n=1 Tax=Asticcacaulis sp. TaxID=1872648 RepID=UPI003F7B567D
MSKASNRHVAGAAALVTWVIAGPVLALWAAGAVFFLMHQTFPQDVTPLTWIGYVRGYWPIETERRLLLLSLIVPGALALFPFGLILGWMGGPEPSLHGDARFALPSEIKRAGLMGGKGIIVGKHHGRFLLFPGQQFCLLAAPTRSGKGVSVVIPNLLNWPDSIVVLDIKLENFLLTSKYRADHGQKVFLFNPFAEDGHTHRWNPLDAISPDPHLRAGDLLALATSLYPALPGEKDAFWAESARNLFLGLALMVLETPELPPTIGEIMRQSAGKGRGLKEYLAGQIAARETAGHPYSHACLDALHRFMSATENTLANIISSFNAPLILFANPLVDAATSASDFDITRIRDERTTIYIGIQPNRLAEASLLINVFFSQLINLNTRSLPSAGRHPYPCLLVLDEFPALGKINILAKANAFIASYNLRLLTIVQSIAQLEATYGVKDARTLITNHAMQILFTPREQHDANAYSEMLGYTTVKSRSTGRSMNRGFGAGGSNSENVSDQRRALMLPQELKALSEDEQIIVLENARPIRCQKARYYRDRNLMDRLKSALSSPHTLKWPPTQTLLERMAFTERRLSSSVPQLDIAGHVAGLARPEPPLVASDIDLSALDIDPDDLPEITDQENPSQDEIDRLVETFFSLANVQPDEILFGPSDSPSPTIGGMT